MYIIASKNIEKIPFFVFFAVKGSCYVSKSNGVFTSFWVSRKRELRKKKEKKNPFFQVLHKKAFVEFLLFQL